MNPIFKLFGVIAIKNDEANTAIDQTTEKAKGLGEALEGAGTSADTTSGKMGDSSKFGAAAHWMGETLYKLTEKAVNLGTNLAKMGFGFNSSIESYQYSFSALLGDAEQAKTLVADIQKLAKETPLGLEKLAENTVTLLTTGTKLEDIIPTLEMLGNLSLGDPGRMSSVVRAYTQILSKGGLMAQEMYQLGDAMVPIKEIMTQFGGERYADGSWYMEKMTDPTYKIPAEDMAVAFQNATAEGGKWHDYMYIIMDSFAGMADRLGEEGKETLGDFFKPFFEAAKSDVMPKLIESMGLFRQWIADNQGTLEKMADAVGGLVSSGFDKLLDALKWMMENGEATAVAIGSIATAMAISAVAAHPYAAAVTAIVAALAMMKSANADGDAYDGFFDKFSAEELQNLQNWIDAVNEARDAEKYYAEHLDDMSAFEEWQDMLNYQNEMYDIANKTEGLIAAYNSWRSGQAENQGKDLYLDVPLRVPDDAEASLQGEVAGMDIEGLVSMVADTSGLQAAVNATNLTGYVNLVPVGGTRTSAGVNGSHASGLDRVPFDGYLARLHRDEAVLTASQADVWRSGGIGGNTGRMEALMTQMLTFLSQMAGGMGGGQQIVLDTGVLVGQLAPALDERLGTISTRKGRRN